LCTVDFIVLDPTVEITSKGSIKHKKILVPLNPSSGHHLWEGRAEYTQHNLGEERKKKEVCPDLVALNLSASTQ
jgi:hypothetical protein